MSQKQWQTWTLTVCVCIRIRSWQIIACTSIVITAVYILRVVGKIIYGTCTDEHHLKLTDATWDERLSVVCLVAAIAGMGLAPLWVSDMIRESVTGIIAQLMS